jgi:hypothetical protein
MSLGILRSKKSSKLFILFSFAFLSFLYSSVTQAASISQEGTPRYLKVWDHLVQYQFLIKEDPKAMNDGEAFTKNVKSQTISYVVLNKAFFEKEARGLFKRFTQSESLASFQNSSTERSWIDLEKNILSLKNLNHPIPSLDSATQLSLKNLQSFLEKTAWLEAYHASLKNTSSSQEAEERFVEFFTKTRMNTIEYHEAAHLIDLLQAGDRKKFDFKRFTELNAFYAELTYGENPHDVMSQAIAGLIDEMGQGKTVDYSIEKVIAVLKFLKECPRFAKAFRGPLQKCCLEILAKLTRSDFILAGKELHHQNLRGISAILASLERI